MHFAVTRIVWTLEDKIDMLLMLYILVKINAHYKVVTGWHVEKAMAREREIMSSAIWESDIISHRSGSAISR